MPVKKKIPAYSLKGVGFSYGTHIVLEHVTVDIFEGDYIGIVGPNGGGKSTLLRILLGVLEPTEGSVKLFGEHLSRSLERSHVGYVPQRASALGEMFPATVEEIITSGRTPQKRGLTFLNNADLAVIDRAVEVSGVGHLLKRRISALSGGERQRVLIARALAGEPRILMLDEPTSAVDAASQEQLYHFLKKLRKQLKLTIILVSHDTDIVAHEVDKVICLNRHLVCHGPAKAILDHPNLIHGHY